MLGFAIDSTWSEIMENEDPNHGFNFNCYGFNPLGLIIYDDIYILNMYSL
jgi:hypothetical protein